jgi:DNA-binding SARP family transcriptional activator
MASEDVWEFGVLGPMRVSHGGRSVPVAANKQRVLLAVLLLHNGETVSTADIVDRVWGEHPPENSATALHSLVLRLRRTLSAAGGSPPIQSHPNGYGVALPVESVDLAKFYDLHRQARAAAAAGDTARWAALLREALSLWRGQPLADTDSDVLQRQDVPAIVERWAQAVEEHFDAELELGRHAELVADLREAVDRNPLREGLWARLMLALYRCGRQVEALEAYRTLAGLLKDELGLEPSPQVQELQRDILRGDTALRPRPSPAEEDAPPDPLFQLPPRTGVLYGRDPDIERLRHLLTADPGSGRPPLVCVSGPPGAGKTALAVEVAHAVRDNFPDGQWFVPLGGRAADASTDILCQLLGYAGVRGQAVPAEFAARVATLRSALAGRRVLLVLDDAPSVAAVEHLLPGGPGCAVIVTSRSRLGGLVALHGASAHSLDTLAPVDAVGLLRSVFTGHGLTVPDGIVDELARLCGYLPLALRIVAANLATGSSADVVDYARRLRDGDRLDALSVDGDSRVAVRAAIEPSYQRLDKVARRALRLQAGSPSSDFTAADLAALLDVEPAEAEAVVRSLAAAHLVRASRASRYTTHDLIRLYALEQSAASDGDGERAAALARLFQSYLATADHIARTWYPRMTFLPLPAEAARPPASGDRRWFDTEFANLLTAIRHAARHGPRGMAVHLADRLRGHFQRVGAHGEWRAIAEAGLDRAHRDGDDEGIAAMEASLGTLSASRADYAEARRRYTAALTVHIRLGNAAAQAAIYNNLGIVHREEGRLTKALTSYHEALRRYQAAGNRRAELSAWYNASVVHLDLDQIAEAVEASHTALTGLLALGGPGNDDDVATALHNFAESLRAAGQPGRAIMYLTWALAIRRRTASRYGEAADLESLAESYVDLGYHAKALRLAGDALAIAEEIDRHRVAAEAYTTRGAAHLGLGDVAAATSDHETALRLSRQVHYRRAEIRAHVGLALCHRAAGRPAESDHHAQSAADLAVEIEHHLLARETREAMAAAATVLDVASRS